MAGHVARMSAWTSALADFHARYAGPGCRAAGEEPAALIRQLGVEVKGVAVLPYIDRRKGRHRLAARHVHAPVVQQTVHLPV